MKLLIIAGFLGSGKTTLLLRVARHLSPDGNAKIAIIENEAGKIGVDDQLIRQTGLKVREIFGGCVCCSLGPNLLSGLKQLHDSYHPDWVIIEPSGIAAPDLIRQLLEHYPSPIALIRLAVLFDIERFAAISHVARPMVEGSIRAADVAVINKIDLARPGQIADIADQIHQHRPELPIVPLCAKDGRGFEQLIEQMKIDPPAPPIPASVNESHDQHRHHAHDGPHAHPGQPLAQVRRIELRFDRPMDAAELVGRLIERAQQAAGAIDANRGSVIGHVKMALEAGGMVAVIRTTSAHREPDVTGELPEVIERAGLTLNVLAYAMDEAALGAIADAAVAQLG